MIERSVMTGARLKWTFPGDDSTGSKDGSIIANPLRHAGPMIYDGMDGELYNLAGCQIGTWKRPERRRVTNRNRFPPGARLRTAARGHLQGGAAQVVLTTTEGTNRREGKSNGIPILEETGSVAGWAWGGRPGPWPLARWRAGGFVASSVERLGGVRDGGASRTKNGPSGDLVLLGAWRRGGLPGSAGAERAARPPQGRCLDPLVQQHPPGLEGEPGNDRRPPGEARGGADR